MQILDGLDEVRLAHDHIHVVGLVERHDLDVDSHGEPPSTPPA